MQEFKLQIFYRPCDLIGSPGIQGDFEIDIPHFSCEDFNFAGFAPVSIQHRFLSL